MPNNNIVACVGDALVDIVVRVDSLPQRGQAVWCPPALHFGGGTAANVVSSLAALGVPTSFHGCVGDDEYGRFLIDELHQQGIDTTGIIKDPNTSSGTVVVMVEPDGERSFVICALGGAHTKLNDLDLQRINDINPGTLFITGVLLIEEPSRSSLLNLAKSRKGLSKIYFDPNLRHPDKNIPFDLQEAMTEMAALSDVILAGEYEADVLSFRPVQNQLFVIKCGVHGARIESPAGTIFKVQAHPVKTVDVIGAGDVFDAAFIAGHHRGESDQAALTFANAAAALSVTKPGARCMPTNADIMALLKD